MTRHLLAMTLFLALGLLLPALVGTASAGDRVPPMYNASSTSVTLTASFYCGGAGVNTVPSSISWTQANGSVNRTFTLTPGNYNRSCVVQISGGNYDGQVDVTCTYKNNDGTVSSQTVTICFRGSSADHITLGATG